MNKTIDYTIFYKELLAEDNARQWDIFISAFNSNSRVIETFEKINALKKHWLIFPEYGYAEEEYPSSGEVFAFPTYEEDEFIQQYDQVARISTDYPKICIDITGFIHTHLVYLIRFLAQVGIEKLDVLYTEPVHYENRDETQFTDSFMPVKQIPGCYSSYNAAEYEQDAIIIAAGYDDKLITRVAKDKEKTKRKYQIFGLPSLQPDMYQENRLRAYNSSDAIGAEIHNYFAPANDPFVTAQLLQEIVDNKIQTYSNLYLSPLSTKPQTLGFILYYIWECQDKSASIIFPYSKKFTRKTSEGISRTWHYTVEFPEKF